jgi:hypothetical protein
MDPAPHCSLVPVLPPTKDIGLRAPLLSCEPVVAVPNSKAPVLPLHVVLPHMLSNLFVEVFQSAASDTMYGVFVRKNCWNWSSAALYM